MSDASLRSARVYSLAILVLGYVGLSFVWGHQQRLATLTEARIAVACIVVASPDSESFPALGEIEIIGTYVLVRRTFGGLWGICGAEPTEDGADNTVSPVPTIDETDRQDAQFRVERPGGAEWSVAGVGSIVDAAQRQFVLEHNRSILHGVAARIGIFDAKDKDESNLYEQIEQSTLGAEVMVPGVGLGFRGMQVVWVSVIATFGFLVILRDRVQHVLSDEGLGVSERWLIIDGRAGIELALSRLWLLALVLMPMALSSGLVLGVTSQIAADGATSGLIKDTLMAAGVLILLTGNGWLALTAASQILELRERRFELVGSDRAD